MSECERLRKALTKIMKAPETLSETGNYPDGVWGGDMTFWEWATIIARNALDPSD